MKKIFEKPELIIIEFEGDLATDPIATSDAWENSDFPDEE